MTERKYQLTRVMPGDYILPSNDGKRLWRLQRYQEGGSLEDAWGKQIKGHFWRLMRFDGSLEEAQTMLEEDAEYFLDAEHWPEWASLQETLRDAIEVALSVRSSNHTIR